MKSSKKIALIIYGIVISALYFIAVLFLYSELDILQVFPVFAGEDDFAVRRLSTFSILIPSFIIIGCLLGFKMVNERQFPIRRILGMLASSIIFGFLVVIFKSKLSTINERDLANTGVLFYFLLFCLVNFAGYFLSSFLKIKRGQSKLI